ncbi:MAG: hypothetical protein WC107_06215 [Patescibacteria group bacterium]
MSTNNPWSEPASGVPASSTPWLGYTVAGAIGVAAGLALGLAVASIGQETAAVVPVPPVAETIDREVAARGEEMIAQLATVVGERDRYKQLLEESRQTEAQAVADLIVAASTIKELRAAPKTLPSASPQPLPQDGWRIIRSWTVTSSKTTETFSVSSREWRVRWSSPHFCTFSVHRADTELVDSGSAHGSDSSMVYSDPGTYYLELGTAGESSTFFVEEPTVPVIGSRKAADSIASTTAEEAAALPIVEYRGLRDLRGGAGKGTGAGAEKLVAVRGGNFYHRASCSIVAGKPAGQLVAFASAAEAASKRLKPCKTCKPPAREQPGRGGLQSLRGGSP